MGGSPPLPDEAWEAGGEPNGPRRGRWFGDHAPWGGRPGTALLVLALVVLVVLFLAVSCLA